MIMFKACPRCQGDMHQNRDMYGEYRECLMCGYMTDIQQAQPVQHGAGPGPCPGPQDGIQASCPSADIGDSSGVAAAGIAGHPAQINRPFVPRTKGRFHFPRD